MAAVIFPVYLRAPWVAVGVCPFVGLSLMPPTLQALLVSFFVEVWGVSNARMSHLRVVQQWQSPFYDESQSTKLVFGLALSVNSFSGFPECV